MHQPTRREVLKQLGVASAGMLAAPIVLSGQDTKFVVAGQPVEIAFSTVNPDCTRITIRRTAGGSDASLADGALAQAAWKPVSPSGRATVSSGQLSFALSQPASNQPLVIDFQRVDVLP